MKFISFPGVNCHLLCLINIAAKLDVNYSNLFTTLWSETSFTKNEKYQIYISKRIFKNFKTCGIIIKKPNYDFIPCGNFFIVGVDTFYIPWSPVYQNFHGSHYFIAKKEKKDIIICFDPIYNKKNIRLNSREIILHAFDICSVTKTSINTPILTIEDEAREVLIKLLQFQKKLYKEIQNCKNKDKSNLEPVIKQIIAMISNRYMFKKFLQNSKSQFSRFFNKVFFNNWQAVKNGLYKASILKDNSKVIDEVCFLIKDIINKEISLAKKMLKNKTL